MRPIPERSIYKEPYDREVEVEVGSTRVVQEEAVDSCCICEGSCVRAILSASYLAQGFR